MYVNVLYEYNNSGDENIIVGCCEYGVREDDEGSVMDLLEDLSALTIDTNRKILCSALYARYLWEKCTITQDGMTICTCYMVLC